MNWKEDTGVNKYVYVERDMGSTAKEKKVTLRLR
jgi:hypothetical protein